MRFSEFPGVGRTRRVEGFRLTAAALGCTDLLERDANQRQRRLRKAISIARSIAGCAGFLILIHSRQRPER